ncbi:MAG: FKBP-type peptidyl-prolyl cis-trans isomerase [Phycisphaerales bacterium]|nr:FKBP-type peptidyl-prolyl cis-trans isomerase [Phycisphaerales bacterium]
MKRNSLILLGVFVSMAAMLSLTACKSKPAATEPAAETAAKPAAAAPETKPAETKPAENKPAETKPAETKVAETKPAEAKPAEAKPAETKTEPAPQVAKKDETKKEEAKKDEAKKEEAKKDETKKDEAKKEEPKPVVTFLNCDKAEPLATKKLDSGVIVEDLKLGEGSECKPGATVTINYHGTLKDGGTMFDSTRGKQPATFPLNRLIKGWQQGVPGMKPGGIRRLTIPYPQAYGENGRPPVIPAKADLVFIIELIGVVEPNK